MPSYLTPQHHGILSSKTDGLLQPISGGGNGRSCAGNSRLRTGLFLPAPQPRAFGQHFRGGYFEECGLSAQSIFSAHPRSDAGSSCADTASESPSGFGQLRTPRMFTHAVQSPRSHAPGHPYFLSRDQTKSAPVRASVPRPDGACPSASLFFFKGIDLKAESTEWEEICIFKHF